MIVQAGKTVYIGKRKFIEGQEIPAALCRGEIQTMTKAQADAVTDHVKRGRPRKTSLFQNED